MSEEIASANHLLIENARLQTDLDLTRAALVQARNNADAEQRARDIAEADNAALRAEIAHRAKIDAEDTHRLQDRYSHLHRQFESLQKWVARGMALHPTPPIVLEGVSAALLAELEAARAVVAAAQLYRRASPLPYGIEDAEQPLWAALDAYSAATKARTE